MKNIVTNLVNIVVRHGAAAIAKYFVRMCRWFRWFERVRGFKIAGFADFVRMCRWLACQRRRLRGTAVACDIDKVW